MLKRSLSINNSVLHRYLRNCDLAHLLQDGQDIEEHLLECASLKLHIQNDNVRSSYGEGTGRNFVYVSGMLV